MRDSEIVYLLDDEPGMVRALKRLLCAEGFTVEGFTSPDDFLRAFQPAAVSCLVLDVAMPRIDGLEFHKQLLGMKIEVPVIFLTGHGDMAMCVRAMKNGASDFLAKPVTAAELLPAVRTALSESALIHAARQAGDPAEEDSKPETAGS